MGATHLTHHCYGGHPPLLPSEITFIPPDELLDTAVFADYGVGAAICAVVHRLDQADQPYPEEAGRFVHLAFGPRLRYRTAQLLVAGGHPGHRPGCRHEPAAAPRARGVRVSDRVPAQLHASERVTG